MTRATLVWSIWKDLLGGFQRTFTKRAFPRFAEKSSLPGSVMRWVAWSFFGIVALAFLWQPIGVGAQLGFATSVIVAMVLVRTFVRGPYMRWTFLALGSFVVLRYLYWRATQTLPDAALAQIISDGKGGMPPFKSSLSEDQIHSLVSYVRSLHQKK